MVFVLVLFILTFLFVLWCILRASSIADEEILKQERKYEKIDIKNNNFKL